MTLTSQIEPRLAQLKKGAEFIKDLNPTLLHFYLETSIQTYFPENEKKELEYYDLTTTRDGFIITNVLTNEEFILIVTPATIFLKAKENKKILFSIQKQANSLLTLINQETVTNRTTEIYKFENKKDSHNYSYYHQRNTDTPIGGTLTSLKTTLKTKNYYIYQSAFNSETRAMTTGINYHEEDKYYQIYTKLQEILLKENQASKRTKKPKKI